MKVRASLFVPLFAVLISGSACSAPDSVVGIGTPTASADLVTEEMYRLTGRGSYFFPTPQPDLVITAIRTFSGNVSGTVVFPEGGIGRVGNVIGIVPPSASYNYWCVAADLTAELGIVLLVYIDDVANGVDRVTFGGGPSATCAAFPAPDVEWTALLTGDFTGTVKTR
jgi:hypothetical protein